MLSAIFLRTIFTYLFVSTFVCFVIIFLTFEALMNTTHRFIIFHYFRYIFVQYIMIYQFIRHVDIRQLQHHWRKVLFMIFFFNSYSIWHHMLTHARFYNLQERLRLDVSFLSLNNFSFNSEFFLQRELYALKATHFFFFNFEIVTILNCFNNAMSIIIRIVDVIFFRVFKILIIFVVLISVTNKTRKTGNWYDIDWWYVHVDRQVMFISLVRH